MASIAEISRRSVTSDKFTCISSAGRLGSGGGSRLGNMMMTPYLYRYQLCCTFMGELLVNLPIV